jgi:hypothetical protein
MTMATLSIDRRFCGPPARVTVAAGPGASLMHGDDLIAEGQETVVELAIPECPSLREARSASTGYPQCRGVKVRRWLSRIAGGVSPAGVRRRPQR